MLRGTVNHFGIVIRCWTKLESSNEFLFYSEIRPQAAVCTTRVVNLRYYPGAHYDALEVATNSNNVLNSDSDTDDALEVATISNTNSNASTWKRWGKAKEGDEALKAKADAEANAEAETLATTDPNSNSINPSNANANGSNAHNNTNIGNTNTVGDTHSKLDGMINL